MTKSRRSFCKNAIYLGLGLSFSPLISHAKTKHSPHQKVLNLSRNSEKTIKVKGKICVERSIPIKNAMIEIWHNNSANNISKFDYVGKLTTDSEGNYSFLTDFPERHFEDGFSKMRRIFMKITSEDQKELLTTLYFGECGEPFIDSNHFQNTAMLDDTDLPTAQKQSKQHSIIQFNIFLNF